MLVDVLFSQWVVVKGSTPLLYTTSNHREIAARKFEKREQRKVGSKGERLINADVIVKDLNLND